jgi:hypothetical protein
MCLEWVAASGVLACASVGIDGARRRDWVVTTFMSRMAPAKTLERHVDAFQDAMLAHCVLRVYRARGLVQALRRQVRRNYFLVSLQEQNHCSAHFNPSSLQEPPRVWRYA